MDGEGAIRGACDKCTMLLEIYRKHVEIMAMMKKFTPPPPPRKRVDPSADLQGNLFGEL